MFHNKLFSTPLNPSHCLVSLDKFSHILPWLTNPPPRRTEKNQILPFFSVCIKLPWFNDFFWRPADQQCRTSRILKHIRHAWAIQTTPAQNKNTPTITSTGIKNTSLPINSGNIDDIYTLQYEWDNNKSYVASFLAIMTDRFLKKH